MTDFPELENAIAINDLETARNLLRPLLESHAENAQIWYLAAKAARNEAQRRHFLEQSVKLDPLFHAAANELHSLNPIALPPSAVANSSVAPSIRFASVWRRFGAFLVDTVILFALNQFFLSLIGGMVSNLQAQVTLLFLSPLLLQWLFQGYYYRLRGGKTYGGRLFGLRVVRLDGKPLGFKDAFMRCILGYFASGIAFGLGFIWQFFNPQRQAWHDILAETIVIEE